MHHVKMEEIVLCTTCFDDLNADRIISIEPRQVCAICGRQCLGYRTVVDTQGSPRPLPDAPKDDQ